MRNLEQINVLGITVGIENTLKRSRIPWRINAEQITSEAAALVSEIRQTNENLNRLVRRSESGGCWPTLQRRGHGPQAGGGIEDRWTRRCSPCRTRPQHQNWPGS
jgi:hypothetical protein